MLTHADVSKLSRRNLMCSTVSFLAGPPVCRSSAAAPPTAPACGGPVPRRSAHGHKVVISYDSGIGQRGDGHKSP